MEMEAGGGRVGGSSIQWADATIFLESVCQDMELGSLIHGENFSLFEAMSALEIMDPKMDAGMATSSVRSVDEAIASGAAPITLSGLELIDVMDHLLACEATWHNGSSLAQTVFTCLYVLDVERTAPNALLHAHCKAVRATCNIIRTLVCKADVREEEDFVTASFGLPLEGDTDSKSLAGLTAAEEAVARRLKAAKGAAPSKKVAEGQGEGTAVPDDVPLDETLCRALLCRIRFRKALYHALANMDKALGRGLDLAKKHLATALSELASMRTTSLSQAPAQPASSDASPSPSSLADSKSAAPLRPTESALTAAGANSIVSSMPGSATPSLPFTAPSPIQTSAGPEPKAAEAPTRMTAASPAAQAPASPEPSAGNTPDAPGRSTTAFGSLGSDASEPIPDLPSSYPQPSLSSPASADADASTTDAGGSGPSTETAGASTASGRRARGFDEAVNRRLLLPTPPRPIRMLSWLETLGSFEKLLQELQGVCEAPLGGSLREVQRFLVALQRRQPGPVARCRVQQLVLQEGKVFGRELLPATLFRELQLPVEGELPKDPLLSTFLAKAARAELRLLRALCGNLSRQRRDLAKLLPDWDDLVHEGERAAGSAPLKNFLESAYPKGWWPNSLLVSWSAEQACRIIRQILLLGFETDLYAPSEYCYVYWYLDHVLATLLHNTEAREKNWAERQHLQESSHGKDKKGKRKKATTGGGAKGPALQFRGSADLALIQCHSDLCKALVRMLVAMKEDRKLQFHETQYNSEQERFEQRFEVLKRVHIPEPMPYAAFRDGTNISGLSVAEVYQMSYEFFQRTASQVLLVKEQLESDADMSRVTREQQLKEIQQIAQVAARNCTALQVAHRAGPGPTLKVAFDFSIHPCFPVASLKRS